MGYTWRLRLGEKLEFIDWDPLLNQEVLCREDKKVKSRLRLGKKFIDWNPFLNQEVLQSLDPKVRAQIINKLLVEEEIDLFKESGGLLYPSW